MDQYLGPRVWQEKHPCVSGMVLGQSGQGEGAQDLHRVSLQVWAQPGRAVPQEPSPCPSGPGPNLRGLLGTPGPDQPAALPMPKSEPSEWARARWHTRGGAGRRAGLGMYL